MANDSSGAEDHRTARGENSARAPPLFVLQHSPPDQHRARTHGTPARATSEHRPPPIRSRGRSWSIGPRCEGHPRARAHSGVRVAMGVRVDVSCRPLFSPQPLENAKLFRSHVCVGMPCASQNTSASGDGYTLASFSEN